MEHDELIASIVGERLRVLRNQRGITQLKLSKEVGVSRDTIAGYESGRTVPPTVNICLLCRYFRVSSDYLLGLTDITARNAVLESKDVGLLLDTVTELSITAEVSCHHKTLSKKSRLLLASTLALAQDIVKEN